MSARPAALAAGVVPPPGDVMAWLDAVAEPLLVMQDGPGGLRLVHANEGFCRAVALARGTLLSGGLPAWLGAEPLSRLERAVQTALTTGRSRCRELDSSGAMLELRRVHGREGDYCLGTLRLPAGAQTVRLSRDELRHRADLLTTAMDLEAMVAWTWDLRSDELCLEYRAAAAEFVPLKEPVLEAFLEQVHPDDLGRVRETVREALHDDRIHRVEFRFITASGQLRWISSVLKRFLDGQGQPEGVLGASRDVTRLKQLHEELADNERRLRTVLDNEPECVKVVDRDFVVTLMNAAGLRMIGSQDAQEVVGQDVRQLVAPEHRAAFEAFHQQVLDGATEMLEFEIVGLQGQRLWVESRAAPLQNAEGEVLGQLAVTRDVTESRRLSHALIETADLEQQRLGHDLHDGLGQDLTGIALMLRGLQGQLDRPRENLRTEIGDIERLVNRTLQGMRALARGLSPVSMEQGGLGHSLRDLASRARESGHLRTRLALRSKAVETLEASTAIQLYRIAQEAFSNALRHAGATRLDVSLRDTRAGLRLRIADNGHGMPADAAGGEGLGLRSMEYRARLIGATLEVLRSASGGTAVVVTLPATRIGTGPA